MKTNLHRYYSPSLFIIVTIHHYYSSMISIITFCCHYSSLLFIDHLITPNFNYSSIMLSSPPKTSQTHIPVIRTLVTVIFLPVGNFPSGHSSQVSPSWARLTLRFLRIRIPNLDSNNSYFWILIKLFPIQPCHPLSMVHVPKNSQNTLVPYSAIALLFIPSQTIHSSLFSPTMNFTVLHHIHSAINTPSYPLPLHTHSTPSAKANTPPTQLLRSAGYTHSVASHPVHTPGKHLHSTTSNITTPHDTDSA
jgi:hypothetical protein